MKITVIRTGYTALAEAAVLCCENDVRILSNVPVGYTSRGVMQISV